jgi:succinate dehydrogenase / fumarate reductase, cytochrome b subunit
MMSATGPAIKRRDTISFRPPPDDPPSGRCFRGRKPLVMSSLSRFLSSSVGTKILVALTGLGFAAFLLTHLAANLLVLVDPHGYNEYSHKLISNPLIYIAEAGLVVLFLVHAFKATMVTLRNREARGRGYALKRRAGHTSRKSLASSTMIVTGIWLLLFVVIHLKTFKFGPWYDTPDGMRDLSRLVHEVYREPLHVAFYVLSMVVVGMHLSWGLSSAFQSMGVEHSRYNGFIRGAGLAVAIVMAAGFALIPVVIYFGGRP